MSINYKLSTQINQVERNNNFRKSPEPWQTKFQR